MEVSVSAARDAELAYEAMAPVYDAFTAHHDYDLWLGELMPKLEAHGLAGRRLLDVGCGTGKSFIPMLDTGWEVTACDISAEMVALARGKVGDRALLSVADMRELPVLGAFDLVFCLDDAVNYLLSTEELEAALRGMAANLAPAGRLMFDVNTLESYRTFFAEHIELDAGDWHLTWDGTTSPEAPPRTLGAADFRAERAGTGETIELVHRQRHFTETDVLAALAAAGLECLDVFGHTHAAIPEQPLEDLRHTKAVYMAGLKDAEGS